jgi:hypothetical protein
MYMWRVEVPLHPFVTLALNEGEWSATLLKHFTTAKSPWYPPHRNTGTGWEGWWATARLGALGMTKISCP